MFTEECDFRKRLREAVSISWNILQQKIANGSIKINKEASLQLQLANIFQSFIPMIIFSSDEKVYIYLEETLKITEKKSYEVDIFIIGKTKEISHRIAIEMKCYREYTSSGKKRGATDIFFKDVYVDLELLEKYVKSNKCDEAVFLAMTDMKSIIYPRKKSGKGWNYDISQGAAINGPKKFQTPIGGKKVNIILDNTYKFNWQERNSYYFLEM